MHVLNWAFLAIFLLFLAALIWLLLRPWPPSSRGKELLFNRLVQKHLVVGAMIETAPKQLESA